MLIVKLVSPVVYVTSQPSSPSFCHFMLTSSFSSSSKVVVEASIKETGKKRKRRGVELDWNWKRDC